MFLVGQIDHQSTFVRAMAMFYTVLHVCCGANIYYIKHILCQIS